jgi:hypothetical protein
MFTTTTDQPTIELDYDAYATNPYTLSAYERATGTLIAAIGHVCPATATDRMDLFLIELGYQIYSDDRLADLYN